MYCTLYFLFGSQLLMAQNLHGGDKSIQIKHTAETIVLDGVMNELTWSSAIGISGFHQNFPLDTVKAKSDTEVMMAYDETNLYIFITCHARGDDFIVPTLKRDFSFFGNDNITLVFDTYNDYTNALVFGMNPGGVRREATISNSGQSPLDFDDSWDNKWDGQSKMYSDRWTSEIAIPFNTLRFSKGSKSWRFNCYRFDTQHNEISAWTDIPGNRMIMDLGYMGNMVWEEPIEKSGRNISIIPYVSASTAKDFQSGPNTITDNKFNAGLDAKIGLTSGLNLDLTINPDFSQVEVDQQVTNIDRFELFFPERRQFFLENADLFGRFGATRINPFFSRRIGIATDPNTGQTFQNKIDFGARLSGKINDNLRVGFLNMQTASQKENELPAFNYTVAVAEQRVTESSRIAFIGVNKQSINPDEFNSTFNEYNRVLGAEYRLNTPGNTWIGKSNFMTSISPDGGEDSYTFFNQYTYTKRKFTLEFAQLFVGNGFNPETGFAPRKDMLLISPEASINFFPKNGAYSRGTLGFDTRFFWKPGKDGNPYITDYGFQEFNFEPFFNVRFNNTGTLQLEANYVYLTLARDFDPTRIQKVGIFLPGGSSYNYGDLSISYESDQRKRFSYAFETQLGTFYNGTITGLNSQITYQYRPLGFVSLDFTYNRIKLDEPFEAADLWIIGPRIDFTFTKKLFFTTFMQYNSQFDNLNINTRLQWRFAPVSDFFIVYTDNYITDPWSNFSSRNRALVAKFTYWINL